LFNVSKYLPPNYDMWVSISDLVETIVTAPCSDASYSTESLERNMKAFLRGNVTSDSAGDSLTITTGGSSSTLRPSTDGLYDMGILSFAKGQNTLTVDVDGLCLEWFRVVGSEAYAGSTDGGIAFPTDRFIGAGERLFAVEKQGSAVGENPIEGIHLIRYRIWLKGGI